MTPPPPSPAPSPFPPATPAREAVNAPGTVLMVLGALWLTYGLYGLISSVVNAEEMRQALRPLMEMRDLPDAFKNMLQMVSGPVAKLINVVSLLMGAIITFGGYQMRSLRMYPMAIAACVVAMIPCSCCCIFGLPLGIWGLTVLSKPDIKAAFS